MALNLSLLLRPRCWFCCCHCPGAHSQNPLEALTNVVQQAANTLAGVVDSTRSAAENVAVTLIVAPGISADWEHKGELTACSFNPY
jgi:hypothetical protein